MEYLRSADRLIETSLAPAALLAARFGLLPEGSNAVELDTLLGHFYRLPRLPKLASPQVLRLALAEGVQTGPVRSGQWVRMGRRRLRPAF